MPKTIHLIFQNAGYDGQHLMGVYSTLDKAILAFERFAKTQLKGEIIWLDKEGYFCSSKGRHKPIIVNSHIYYISKRTINSELDI